MKNGRVVEFKGRAKAETLQEVIENADANENTIAEFAIGTSHKSELGGQYEKGMMGTVDFALGDNHHCYPGGQSVSNVHLVGVSGM